MTLPTTGKISLVDIYTEFGGDKKLKSYYKGGTYVTANDYAPNVPSSGKITEKNFYGAQKNQLRTVTFTNSRNWTAPSTLVGPINVFLVGGGGGGGNSAYANGYPYGDGGNGGRGGLASTSTSVTQGGTYYIEVGAGGAKGYWVFGYKDNPKADGYSGGGGGQSSAFGAVAGGGGGGGGGDPNSLGGLGGGGGGGVSYGGSRGQGNTNKYDGDGNIVDGSGDGGNGGGTGNYLVWNGNGYGGGGHTSGAKSGGPQYDDSSTGTQGFVLIQGYW